MRRNFRDCNTLQFLRHWPVFAEERVKPVGHVISDYLHSRNEQDGEKKKTKLYLDVRVSHRNKNERRKKKKKKEKKKKRKKNEDKGS